MSWAWIAPIFSGVAALISEGLSRSRFDDPLVNLPFPRALRVVLDGMTMNNGATRVPIIVVVTAFGGRVVSELADAPIS